MSKHRWDRTAVVDSINRLVARGQSISSRGVRAHSEPLYSAAVYYFGSWNAALRAAGQVPPQYPTHLWTREEMLEAIRRAHRNYNNTLAQTLDKHFRRNGSGIFESIRYAFGSLPIARKVAGVPELGRWTRARVLRELKAEAESGPISYGTLESRNYSLLRAATTHFGSWSKAVRAAGVRTTPRHNHHGPSITWTRDVVVQKLREGAKKGLTTVNPLRREYAGIYKAAQREFGSWWKALHAAGIKFKPLQ